jgi:2-C-methyl-D-erythritol 4-phosphate cytidylyltransferase
VKQKLKIHTIIVAAGTGSRFGADMPKQFCNMLGRPVLMHTIDAIRMATDGDITLVLSHDMREFWAQLCEEHKFVSPTVVDGGATRWHSVKNAVDTLAEPAPDIVLVHDGARPIVDGAMVQRLVTTAAEKGAAIPVIAVTDSLRVLPEKNANIGAAVDRSLYRAVQTPQAFKTEILVKAYRQQYTPMFTDDASVVEMDGNIVVMVEGDVHNIKITNPGDISIAENCKL